MLENDDFALDVLTDVYRDFQIAVERGRVYRDHANGWLVQATIRRTSRLARQRARHQLDLVASFGEEAIVETLAANDLSPETAAMRSQLWAHDRPLLAALSSSERELLLAKLDGTYDALATLRATSTGNLRREACLLVQRLTRDLDAPQRC